MKKTALAIVIAIVAIGGIALGISMMHKDGKKNTQTSSTPNSSGSSNMNSMNSASSGSSTAVATDKVSIADFAFSPASITVKKGTTVTWTNNDSTAHTVTGDDNTAIDSGTLNKGDTYTFTFNTAGTFAYHCAFHSSMTASVTVTE